MKFQIINWILIIQNNEQKKPHNKIIVFTSFVIHIESQIMKNYQNCTSFSYLINKNICN